MKVKAFSKEGLQAPQKDNPQERAKTEMRDKVNQHVEHLETQVCHCRTACMPALHHLRLHIHYYSKEAHSSDGACQKDHANDVHM